MLNITKAQDNSTVTIALEGRLDTATAPQLDAMVAELPGDVTNAVFDMEKLSYVSSAGLRVLLRASKIMASRGGEVTCVNVPELIMETFEMTGFLDILSVK